MLTGIFVILVLSFSGYTSASMDAPVCGYNPLVAELLGETDQNKWLDWIEKLSGAEAVQISTSNTFIQTRETRLMFTGQTNARGYEFVLEQVNGWYPHTSIAEHEYDIYDIQAKNLIVTIPGLNHPDEVVLMSAHLDFMALGSDLAPGANDNGTGSAALLEAARLLRQYQFDRTIQLVWFTGEEDGMTGSGAFVRDHADQDYTGVINMDMIGWDGDGDRCFDIHTDDENPGSMLLGECIGDLITAYNLDLQPEFVDAGRSDQMPFHEAGISAIGMHENVIDNPADDSCLGTDMNSRLHSIEDTVALNLTPDYGFAIAQAGLASGMELAQPLSTCFTHTLQSDVSEESGQAVVLGWNTIPKATATRVYRSSFGCEGTWQELGETSDSEWQDDGVMEGWPYQYQVEAVGEDGVCVSRPSNCVSVGPAPPPVYEHIFMPLVY